MKKRLLVIFVFIFFQICYSDLSADISWEDESSFYSLGKDILTGTSETFQTGRSSLNLSDEIGTVPASSNKDFKESWPTENSFPRNARSCDDRREEFSCKSLISYKGKNEMKSVNDRLMNWIKSNVSPKTLLPLSFCISKEQKNDVYGNMGEADSVPDIIERIIVEEGLVIYDGAVAQIVLTISGGEANLNLASIPVEIYWEGHVGDLKNIRAGYQTNKFVYDPDNPESVSSDINDKGNRGFIFRIINANGRYETMDPLDGKTKFHGFPTWPIIHWEDWKPIAGENAWVVMAALHLYHEKYYDDNLRVYRHDDESIELKLAEELARAALLLRAENGGIRMAPIGTYRDPSDCSIEEEKNKTWWYNHISSENNISWYAAFRMLYAITQKQIYRQAMEGIESYLKIVWDSDSNSFYQGMYFADEKWKPNIDHFALDVQAWGLIAFGPEKIDGWFGEGTSYRMWQTAKTLSGSRDGNGKLLGVGFTHEHDRVSVEWTAGAIFAARVVSAYYMDVHPKWSKEALNDAEDMRKGIEFLRKDFSLSKSAYSYSSRRGWIPFGWYSHHPDVVSLASTGWVLFVDRQFNPFFLRDKQKNTPRMAMAGVSAAQ